MGQQQSSHRFSSGLTIPLEKQPRMTMPPPNPREGSQHLCEDRHGQQQRSSEPHRGGKTPLGADSTAHGGHEGGRTPNVSIDLTGNACDPEDTSRKHGIAGESQPDASSKRPKLEDDRTASSETISTSDFMSATSALSGDESLYSKADNGRLPDARTNSKLELSREHRAHAETADRLESTIEALEALRSHKVQLEAAITEKEDFEISILEKLNAKDRELNAAAEEFAKYQNKTVKRIAELEKGNNTAIKKYKELESRSEAYVVVNEDYARKFTKLDARIKSLGKKATETKDRLKKLQAEHEAEKIQLRTQIEELNTYFESQIEQRDETTEKLLQQVQESEGLSQRYNFKVSDDEIGDDWGNIKHGIRQFVDRHIKKVPQRHPQLEGKWIELSPVMSELLASPLLYAFSFEAYLWEWLCLAVFNPNSLVWAGDLGRSLDKLTSKVEDQLRGPDDELMTEYHSWRATSCNLLSRVSERGYDETAFHENICEVIDALHTLLGPDFNKDIALQDLTEIFKDAREFEIKRRKLKSQVVVCFGACDDAGTARRYNMPVDKSLMRKRKPEVPVRHAHATRNSGPIVVLVVSPAIVRWGNSNGVDYDRKTCLVKMDVLYSQWPIIVPQPTPLPGSAASNGQAGQRSTTTNERGPSAIFQTDALGLQGQQCDLSILAGQPSWSSKAGASPATITRGSRCPRAAENLSRLNCAQQLNEMSVDEQDELNGDPDETEDTKSSKPPRAKTCQSTKNATHERLPMDSEGSLGSL